MALRRIAIDRDRLRAALRTLPDESLRSILDDAFEQLPVATLRAIVGPYLDLRRLRPDDEPVKKGSLLAAVTAFETASLAGDYYEDFDVDSKNFMEKSRGTKDWIAECGRLLDRCVAQAKTGDPAEVCQAFGIIFGLLDRLDEGQGDIIFFADEAGAWQVGVDWDTVLPPNIGSRILRFNIRSTVGLRDRALIGVMVYSFARVSAVLGMRRQDYFPQGKRWWLRLHEKGSKRHDVPAHHLAEAYLDAYLERGALTDPKAPLFQSVDRARRLTGQALGRREVLDVIKRRAAAAGLPPSTCCHTFRATGITAYLSNGGTLEHAQQIAAHASPKTTKLYDRTRDTITLDEIERIVI